MLLHHNPFALAPVLSTLLLCTCSVFLSPVPYCLDSVPLHHCHFLRSFVDVHLLVHFCLCNVTCVTLPILPSLCYPCAYIFTCTPTLDSLPMCSFSSAFNPFPALLLFLMGHTPCPCQRTFEFSSFCSNPCSFASMSLPLLPYPCAGTVVFCTLYSSFVPYTFTYLLSSLLPWSHCPCALSQAHFPCDPVSKPSPLFPLV